MYTVTISKGLNPSNQRIFTLTYSNGERTYEESFLMSSYVSSDNVAKMASQQIAQLNLEDENFDAIVHGEITPASALTPTQEEIDAEVLNQKRLSLFQAKQDLDLGLITQSSYDNQLAAVQATISIKGMLQP